jgi:O-antigen/teichoic acid export membrane protein
MLLSATVGLGGVLSSGTGAATIKAVSTGIGQNAVGSAERTINASVAIAFVGGGILAAVVLSIFWFGASTVLGRMGDPWLVRLTGIAAALIVWLEQVDNVFSSAMKGAEYFGAAARVEISSKTIQIIGAALVLAVSPTLWSLYATLVVVAVLRLLVKYLVARKLLGVTRVRPSFVNARDILHFAKWGWLQGVGTAMFGVADRILVGSLLGANSLTYYSIASQLAMQVHAISAAGLSVIFPKVSRMLQDSRRFSIWRVAKLTMAGNLLLSTSLATILILLGPKILNVWIGAESAGPTAKILPWLVVAYWILSLNSVLYYMLLGMGRIRVIGLTALGAGTIAVVGMYVAVSALGLAGAPLGRGIYAVLSLFLAFPLAQSFLKQRDIIFRTPSVGVKLDNESLS